MQWLTHRPNQTSNEITNDIYRDCLLAIFLEKIKMNHGWHITQIIMAMNFDIKAYRLIRGIDIIDL